MMYSGSGSSSDFLRPTYRDPKQFRIREKTVTNGSGFTTLPLSSQRHGLSKGVVQIFPCKSCGERQSWRGSRVGRSRGHGHPGCSAPRKSSAGRPWTAGTPAALWLGPAAPAVYKINIIISAKTNKKLQKSASSVSSVSDPYSIESGSSQKSQSGSRSELFFKTF